MSFNTTLHPNYPYYKQQAKYYNIECEFNNFCNTKCMAELSVIMAFFTGRRKKYLNNFSKIVPYLVKTTNSYEISHNVCEVTNNWQPYILTPQQKYDVDWKAQQKRNETEIKNTEFLIKLKTAKELPKIKNIILNSPHQKLLLNIIPRDALHLDYLVELVHANIFFKNGQSYFPYICLEDMFQYFNNFTEIDYSFSKGPNIKIAITKPITNKMLILYNKYLLCKNKHLSETELLDLARANYALFSKIYGICGYGLETYNYPVYQKYKNIVNNPLNNICARDNNFSYKEIPFNKIVCNIDYIKKYILQDPYYYFICFISPQTQKKLVNISCDYSLNTPCNAQKDLNTELISLLCNTGIELRDQLILPTRKVFNALYTKQFNAVVLKYKTLQIEQEKKWEAERIKYVEYTKGIHKRCRRVN